MPRLVHRAGNQTLASTVEADNNGNLWAWWGDTRENAVVTGSHLDSVPNGGGYDGALGAMSELKGRGAVWTEERGTSDEGRRRLKASRKRTGNTA